MSSDLYVQAASYWLPKYGSSEEEYEDAFAAAEEGSVPFRAAVSDGATESAFARLWANLLVNAYVESGSLRPQLDRCRSLWQQRVDESPGHLPWYGEMKIEEGAHATFLGIELSSNDTWTGTAVGDCCLIQIRNGSWLTTWPLGKESTFDNQPDLVTSATGGEELQVKRRTGPVREGDMFWLMTDAVAEWLLARPGPVATGSWTSRWKKARKDGSLRNDDCTLIELTVHS